MAGSGNDRRTEQERRRHLNLAHAQREVTWAALGIDRPRLRRSLEEAGGHCDCEVLANTDPDQAL